ncbi:type VII secretion target [Mycobacterium sp. 236(2023)]|uniref:type VII secretion target n=1 Tax=Mycobacterium sp. 236(2023) TaxID=3038163 RepID=UPI002415209F|nr:type VII secretion target [Mycobacterium sp. 236(2023)]MDG4664041.1 type VII secretion target [Mycobacterium sp. 236(2023)]
MGTADAARVDTGAVRAMAQEFGAVSSIVDDAVRKHLSHFDFGGATAGRAYVHHGDALRQTIFGVAASLQEWSRAAAEIAAVLETSADRYEDSDAAAARRLG